MRCELIGDVRIERFAVLAEVAWLERRPELGALCRAAREKGRRIDAATVQRALPGVAAAGATNVAAWCRLLGLCDAQGGLTALGERAADTEEAPVPEQGVLDLWVADHPLLAGRILHARRVRPTRDGRFENAAPLPLRPELSVARTSVVSPGERMVLRDLPAAGGEPRCLRWPTPSSCRVRWTIDFGAAKERWHLEGSLEVDGELRPMNHTPEPAGVDLAALEATWATTYLAHQGRWRADERRLEVAFERLPEAAQDHFRRTYRVATVEVPGRGSFRDVELRDVPLGPASQADAQRWARARFDRRLAAERAYRTPDALRDLFAKVVNDTPLAPFRPALPEQDTLLRELAGSPAVFWTVAAPVDLALPPKVAATRAPTHAVVAGGAL